MPEVSSYLTMRDVKLLRVDYGVNEKYEIQHEKTDITIELNTVHKVKKLKNKKMAIVSLEVKLFQRKPEYPIWVNIKNQATFEWQEDSSKLDEMLDVVAPAHLLSYIRPIVSQLTTMSGFPPLILPLLDFSRRD